MRNADISCALRMASLRRELRYAAVSSGDSRWIGRVRDTRSIVLLRIASLHPGRNTAECLRHGTLDIPNAFASMSEWLRAGSNAKQDDVPQGGLGFIQFFQRLGDERIQRKKQMCRVHHSLGTEHRAGEPRYSKNQILAEFSAQFEGQSRFL
jgi:hypothetical protein